MNESNILTTETKLSRLNELVNELKNTNSINQKKEIISKYPECSDLLYYIYNQLKQYGVTSSNLKKLDGKINKQPLDYDDLVFLLEDLDNKKLTGHEAISTVNNFISKYDSYRNLLYNIFDRNLKCRIQASIINSVFPSLIPEFDVSLAKDYKDYKHKVNFQNDDWLCSRKLDGVRCIAIKKENKIDFISRNGKPFFTLGKLEEEIRKLPQDSFVLDGEVCIINENDEEDFKSITSEIKRKNHIIENPKFKIFDFLTIDEFESKYSENILSTRLNELHKLLENYNGDKLSILDQIKIENEDHLEDLRLYSIEQGWEGLVIRKDTVYEGKRNNNMLKVKQFFEDEFVVEDIESDLIRHIIDDKNGGTLEVEDLMMSRVFIRYKGYKVGVGSGWSMEDRMKYHMDSSLIIGKTITVQHFGETTNDRGGLSLRFPTVKFVYDGKRDI